MTVPATTHPAHAVPAGTPHGSRPAHHPEPAAGRRPAPWAVRGHEPAPGSSAATALDPRLVGILRCPLTGGTLIPVDADRLMSDRPFRDGVHPVYPISNGIACLRPVR